MLDINMKHVMILTGVGQMGMAIARRMGYEMKIVIGDKKHKNTQTIARIINDAGFDVVPVEMDFFSRTSIQNIIFNKVFNKLFIPDFFQLLFLCL